MPCDLGCGLHREQCLQNDPASVDAFLKGTTLLAINALQSGVSEPWTLSRNIVMRFRQDGSLLRRRTGNRAYALIDCELLKRITSRLGLGDGQHTIYAGTKAPI